MSYRNHEIENEYIGLDSSPELSSYALGSDRIFSSPSPDSTQRHGYSAVPKQLAQGEEAFTVDTQLTTQHISNIPPPQKLRFHRTFSSVSVTEEMLRKWSAGIHWYVPTSMIVVFIFGCLGAFGHHMFYSYLHDKPASNQLMMNRYGTALAFFTKAALVGSVVLAYRQRVWHTLRNKAVTIRGLDALFSVVEDPSWFVMAPEMFLKARLATVMALVTWLIPIASVLSPGSLTAQMIEVHYPDLCKVNTINFTQEADSDWRNPRQKRMGFNLAYFNTTPPPPATSVADWYDQPSFQSSRITYLAFYSNDVVAERQSPCFGYNCTYQTEFYAPWYNCSKATFDESPLNAAQFVPNSPPLPEGKNFIYKAEVDSEETRYERPQKGYNDSEYKGQGTFKADPDVWFGIVVNTTIKLDSITEASRWHYVMEPHAYRCKHQKAKYTVDSRWINDRLASRKATISEGKSLLGERDSIGPKDDIELYKEFIGYYTVGHLMRDTLSGQITQDNQTQGVVTTTKITSTRLVNQLTQYPANDFIKTFQKFYEDFIMSFMSEPFMEIAKTEEATCLKTRWENRFRYLPPSLWVGYAVAIFVAFCSVVVGCISIRYNGMCSDTTFSKILVTTRNKTLDKLVMRYPGVALGGDPMPKELENTELRFGFIDVEQSEERAPLIMKHTAFGLSTQTTPIHKNDVRDTLEAQNDSEIELGRRGPFFPGAGLGALPG